MKHITNTFLKDGFEIVELKNDTCCSTIAVNIGNTLISLKKNNEKLYFPYSLKEYSENNKLAGNPFMHPWANRLQHDAIKINDKLHIFPDVVLDLIYRDGNKLPLHGLLLKSNKWKTIELTTTENSCYHIAEFIFNEDDVLSIFPFKHSVQIKHTLINNKLIITTTIINRDEKPMPICFGFHPYFLVEENKRKNTKLIIPAKNVLEVDNKMIPTGNLVKKETIAPFINHTLFLEDYIFDNGFVDLISDNGMATFLLNDIEISMNANFTTAQIYAPNANNKTYVCIEPMTTITNALNTNNCPTINKNEKFCAIFSIAV